MIQTDLISIKGALDKRKMEYYGFLFGYLEYVGRDFDVDMAKMAADPHTQKWWAVWY